MLRATWGGWWGVGERSVRLVRPRRQVDGLAGQGVRAVAQELDPAVGHEAVADDARERRRPLRALGVVGASAVTTRLVRRIVMPAADQDRRRERRPLGIAVPAPARAGLREPPPLSRLAPSLGRRRWRRRFLRGHGILTLRLRVSNIQLERWRLGRSAAF